MRLKIVNLKNGLSKMVDASAYTANDLAKSYLAYEGSGNFMVKVIR